VVAPGPDGHGRIITSWARLGCAHPLNPAVTLAFAVRRNFPWNRVPRYIAAQFVGGHRRGVFLRVMFGNVGLLGATVPGPRHQRSQDADFGSVLLTAGFSQRNSRHRGRARETSAATERSRSAAIFGGSAGLWAAPISGASDESRSIVRARLAPRQSSTPTWI